MNVVLKELHIAYIMKYDNISLPNLRFIQTLKKGNYFILKDILLDILVTVLLGLIGLILIGLIISIIIGVIIGCVTFPKYVVPIVVIIISYIIGRSIKNGSLY